MPDETKVDQNATAKPPTPEELLAGNATPEGRARTAAMFGVRNEEGVGDTIIDVFEGDPEGKALHDDMTAHFGGEQGFAAASTDLTEAVLIADPAGEFGKAIEGMTRAQENAAIKEVVAEWRSILSTPEKAQAVLTGLYGNPVSEPMRSYIRGNASPAVSNAFAKLWQAAYGEKPTGIPPRQGDGFVR